jgi:hypothetical protein
MTIDEIKRGIFKDKISKDMFTIENSKIELKNKKELINQTEMVNKFICAKSLTAIVKKIPNRYN